MRKSQAGGNEAVETPEREEASRPQTSQAVGAQQRERRFVYTGEAGGATQEYLTRGNRPLKRRRKSPFKIVSLIAAISFLIVFYVWNKITVNRLAADVDALGVKLRKIESVNKVYESDINRKSNLDAITKVARNRLGMIESPEHKIYFEIDNYE